MSKNSIDPVKLFSVDASCPRMREKYPQGNPMKRFIAILLMICLFTISLTPKSEAGIGILIKSRSTRVVGGVISATSGATIAGATVFNIIFGNSYVAIAFAALGVVGVAVGLVVLDEKNADLKFKRLSLEAVKRLGIKEKELEIYNSEVDELNVIKEVIESQVSDHVGQNEVTNLWNQYKETLSPETMNVASKIALSLFQGEVSLVK